MKSIKILSIFLFLIIMVLPAFSKEDIINVNVGDNFKIELKSNPTTGYQWQLAEPINKNTVELVSSDYILPNTNLTGAGGKEVWIFKAIKAGEIKISLKYVRSWENVQPIDQNTYVIKVKNKK